MEREKGNYSVIRAFSGLILLIAIVLIVNMVLSVLSVLDLRNHNRHVIEQTVSEYYSQQELRFNSVRHYVEWTAVNEPLLKDLRDNADEGTIAENLKDLRSRIRDMQYTFGGNFMFFVCSNDASRFYTLSDLTVSYSDYLPIRDFITAEAVDSSKKPLRWEVFRASDKPDIVPYLYYGVLYDGMYVCSVIRADALKGSLESMSIGQMGSITLTGAEGELLLSEHGTGGSIIPFFYRDFFLASERQGLPYNVLVHADVYNSIAEQQLRQILVLLVLLILLAVAVRYIYRVNKSVLQPLEKFQNTLTQADNEDSLLSLEDAQVKELAAASKQMKSLVTDLHTMRIKMYEEELEKRKFEVTFLQHQIRPHFYLNCLSTIDSMAQLGETEELRQMTLFTSQYIRYLFQAGRDFVRLQYELDHIEAYLNIQNLRMGHTFNYTQDCDPTVLEASVPPLFMITFVENSVKHAVSPNGQPLQIHISCKHEGDDLFIRIEDSGSGFPARWLALSSETPTEGPLVAADERAENHIGIRNSIRRLSLIYGENLSLHLSNKPAPDHGACVEIRIPWSKLEPSLETSGEMRRRTEL